MAWMVAFNDGLFDDTPPDTIPARLTMLEGRTNQSGLSLNSPREQWVKFLSGWLAQNRERNRP